MDKLFSWLWRPEAKRPRNADDTQEYREGYPGKPDLKHLNANLQFFRNKIPSQPDNVYIDDMLKHLHNDMEQLEAGHSYIQWLFPIREKGQNSQAQELQPHEADAIRKDPQAMERFIRSYKMMLHFYGMRLVDPESGKIGRADNWQEQFRNLNFSEHNFLRITRILKSLGEMGLERYKYPFLEFVLTEAIETRELQNTLESCNNYWMATVKDDAERDLLKQYRTRLVEQRQQSHQSQRAPASRRGDQHGDVGKQPTRQSPSIHNVPASGGGRPLPQPQSHNVPPHSSFNPFNPDDSCVDDEPGRPNVSGSKPDDSCLNPQRRGSNPITDCNFRSDEPTTTPDALIDVKVKQPAVDRSLKAGCQSTAAQDASCQKDKVTTPEVDRSLKPVEPEPDYQSSAPDDRGLKPDEGFQKGEERMDVD